ncbi:hypothetical protein SH1V18_34190 [Vallitalea longa]|uniref:Prepilin type IV endopeptidase peptidase domain-containing protein n=1 Tax=Vallitalea longa TaxID=2936439 RepID=A0A9W5YFE4_9FIRM|nr:A24 family peptidase [Vallitalea longa]GKX30939.1 hypothetical protein SH1V18_34190 [Vallitalea longa]
MEVAIIILGLLLGTFTSCYVLDINLKTLIKFNKRLKIKCLIISIAMAIVSFFIYCQYGYSNHFIAVLLTSWFLISVSISDWKDKQIPVDILIITDVLGVILLFFNPNVELIHSMIGFFGVGGFVLLISIITRKAIGMGDAIVIGTIGLILGYKMALTVLVYSLVLVGLIGLVLMTIGKVNRKTQLPMVPFILTVFMVILII